MERTMKTITILFVWLPFAATSLLGATLKGTDGHLPGNWKLGIESDEGRVDIVCEHSPLVLFEMLTITCGERPGPGSVSARVDGVSGRLGGWRVGAPDGLQWRTICNTPYADVQRNLIICRD